MKKDGFLKSLFKILFAFGLGGATVISILYFKNNEEYNEYTKGNNVVYDSNYDIYFENNTSYNYWHQSCNNEETSKVDMLLQHTNKDLLQYFHNDNGAIIFVDGLNENLLGTTVEKKFAKPIIFIYYVQSPDNYKEGISIDVLNHELLHHFYAEEKDIQNDAGKLYDKVVDVNVDKDIYENENEYFAYHFAQLLDPTGQDYNESLDFYVKLDLGSLYDTDEFLKNEYYNNITNMKEKITKTLSENLY